MEAEIAAAILVERQRVIDIAARKARGSGWCEEFERIMEIVYPTQKPWLASDGLDCRGYDREGYKPDGFNRQGLDREGYDKSGYNVDGRDREGYDTVGFNADGVGRDGLTMFSPEYLAEFKYTRDGYDIQGYSRNGYNFSGLNRAQNQEQCIRCIHGYPFPREGNYHYCRCALVDFKYDRYGYTVEGLNHHGQTRYGVNPGNLDQVRRYYSYNSDGRTYVEVSKQRATATVTTH